ncbi:tRNA:m(4)X modification enzyme TRM13 homolog isoform X1 [Scophthalmus maximus]|uniref:tRNA:m(4)X modification enzyme TRM13 homolog isoform X1 n=1 Tax=Scophthalmus maximus TaxID=52904 RepID=UPI001FA929AA|nr:tRNA:m(4)X modification enzyme TRM13 homolog isoform X1 [Scophthalmus maximus]
MQHGGSAASVSSNMAAPASGSCGFFVEKKKRFCKMIVGRGRRFCGEHATMERSSSRIVCPLDPKHTVSEDKLEKHLKKCNSREKDKPVYYVENINAGSADGDEPLPQVSLCERSRAELQSLLDKLRTATGDLHCDVDDRVLSHPVVEEELNNPQNGGSAHKHLKQQSSIVGHLEELGLLGGGRCFVEFGAGRGKLSHWIHEALKDRDPLKTSEDLQLLLVERCSTRFKVDGKHQDTGAQFERLQVDIQHLDLSKVPLIRKKKLPLVGIGKHLCGAATDLALRCLLDTPGHRAETAPPPKRLKTSEPAAEPDPDSGSVSNDPGAGSDHGPVSGPVLGLAVALCCHHRCEWHHYVGQRFFLQLGLGPTEFSAFCRMSSWATCGLRPTRQDRPPQDVTNQGGDDEEHEVAEEPDAVDGFLSPDERQTVGRLCKLLIDSGRVHFLSTRGFRGRLSRYVDASVTLENVLLTATPPPDCSP